MRLLTLSTPKAGALPDATGVRGVALSHLIGLSVAIQFLLERAVEFSLPYNRLVDLPIRLVLVWLILDRVGRHGRYQITAWDVFNLSFVALHGLASVYADLFMARDAGLLSFIEWGLQFTQPFFYFLAVREGLNRRGFRVDIVLNWLIGVIAFTCVIALAQALNFGGLRHTIDDFYHQRQAEMMMEGPSAPWQARGVMAHANGMAMLILVGFCGIVAKVGYRRWTWFELGSAGLYLATLFATYSRTGIVTMVALIMAFVLMLFVQKRYAEGFVAVGLMTVLLALFLVSVEVFNIERYKVFTKGVGVVKNESSRGLWGWYQRARVMEASRGLMEKYPVTGVAAASSALNRQRMIVRSAYTVEGLLFNIYAYTFVSYGLYGIFYLVGAFGTCIYQLRFARSNRAFAGAAFFCGVMLMVSGVSENTLFSLQTMVIVNCIVALGLTKIPRGETGKPDALASLRSRFLGPAAQAGA